MALKDVWVDKIDGEDINSADDINQVAQAVIELERKTDGIKVPTKLSELTGDATHRTVTDAEKTAWNAKLGQSDLQAATNAALEQAKESGEFKGDKGDKGEDGEPREVVQVTGQSTTAVMSQKAATELFASKSDITDLQAALIGVSDLIGGDS